MVVLDRWSMRHYLHDQIHAENDGPDCPNDEENAAELSISLIKSTEIE